MKVSNYCQDWHPGGGARTIVTERDGVRTERYIPRSAPNYMGLTNFGSANDPELLRAMNNGELAEYQRRQGALWPYGQRILGMQNSIIARPRKPTMTLAEWDARRAAFRALEKVK